MGTLRRSPAAKHGSTRCPRLGSRASSRKGMRLSNPLRRRRASCRRRRPASSDTLRSSLAHLWEQLRFMMQSRSKLLRPPALGMPHFCPTRQPEALRLRSTRRRCPLRTRRRLMSQLTTPGLGSQHRKAPRYPSAVTGARNHGSRTCRCSPAQSRPSQPRPTLQQRAVRGLTAPQTSPCSQPPRPTATFRPCLGCVRNLLAWLHLARCLMQLVRCMCQAVAARQTSFQHMHRRRQRCRCSQLVWSNLIQQHSARLHPQT